MEISFRDRIKHRKGNLKELEVTDVTEFDEVYTIQEKIGEGSYGSVFRAKHKANGTEVAVKTFKRILTKRVPEEVQKEINFMKECDSPYIVSYIATLRQDSSFWIVMEFCRYGSLSNIMRIRKHAFLEPELSLITHDIVMGLDYLHSKEVIHRDIKPGNILMNHYGESKLADFGGSGKGSRKGTMVGSPSYFAPEILASEFEFYNFKVDIWSLGITVIELAQNENPYVNIHPIKVIYSIPRDSPPTLKNPEIFSTELLDFLGKCMVKNPEERASTKDLLETSFIKNHGEREQVMKPTLLLLEDILCEKSSSFFQTSKSDPSFKKATIEIKSELPSPASIRKQKSEEPSIEIEESNDNNKTPTPASNDWWAMMKQDLENETPAIKSNPPNTDLSSTKVSSFIKTEKDENNATQSSPVIGITLQSITEEENSKLMSSFLTLEKMKEEEEKRKIANQVQKVMGSRKNLLSKFFSLRKKNLEESYDFDDPLARKSLIPIKYK